LTATSARGLVPAVRVQRFPQPAARVLVVACVLVAAAAAADSRSGDDRSTAQALIDTITADQKRASVAKGPLDRAKQALARASEARAAADHPHGSRLESVARQWAETARDLVRAAEAERQAEQLERRAQELEAKLVRARALVEETVARHGRAQEMLEQLGRQGGGAATKPGGPK
jgi:hypothetical protein